MAYIHPPRLRHSLSDKSLLFFIHIQVREERSRPSIHRDKLPFLARLRGLLFSNGYRPVLQSPSGLQ